MRPSALIFLVGSMFCIASGVIGGRVQVVAESNVEKRTVDGKIAPSEREEQESLFNYYFGERNLAYETKLSELKTAASVPSWRIPYSAAIHSESMGGMSDGVQGGGIGILGRRRWQSGSSASGSSPLSAYDRAFNGGVDRANSYEVRRIMGTDRALFPARRMRLNSEGWEGYCSGFTASTIKHPEPVNAVDAGQVGGTPGIVLHPADIKGLLTCIYNRTTDDSYLYLAPPSASNGGPNMGTFHLALANYIGQAGHPVGIDRTKGQVSWNNPAYAYESKIRDAEDGDSGHRKLVDTTVTYTFYSSDGHRQTDTETGDRQGNVTQAMVFRYTLSLDDDGRIVGGTALTDNGHFLWIPLYAVQGKEDGSTPGNPYIDVRKVLALARASALADVQKKFDESTIGPAVDPSLTAPAQASTDQPKAEPEP